MYCKNCGNEINENAAICVKCGVKVGAGNNYCQNCGQTTDPNAAVCTNCGFAIRNIKSNGFSGNPGEKTKLVAGLLGIFLGGLGIHNFYLGNTGKAVAQLLITLLGSCIVIGPAISGIWALIEGIMILTGSIKTDAKGIPLAD